MQLFGVQGNSNCINFCLAFQCLFDHLLFLNHIIQQMIQGAWQAALFSNDTFVRVCGMPLICFRHWVNELSKVMKQSAIYFSKSDFVRISLVFTVRGRYCSHVSSHYESYNLRCQRKTISGKTSYVNINDMRLLCFSCLIFNRFTPWYPEWSGDAVLVQCPLYEQV